MWKKKKKKGQGYKTRYLKKQRTKQYSISHRTNDVEKSEITKFCSLLKKKKTSTLDKVIKTANFKGGISTLSFVKLYVKLKKFLEVVSGVDVFYRDSLGDCEPHASICGIHVDTALIRHRSREQRRLWRVDPGQWCACYLRKLVRSRHIGSWAPHEPWKTQRIGC